jgi:hypothetical protein
LVFFIMVLWFQFFDGKKEGVVSAGHRCVDAVEGIIGEARGVHDEKILGRVEAGMRANDARSCRFGGGTCGNRHVLSGRMNEALRRRRSAGRTISEECGQELREA